MRRSTKLPAGMATEPSAGQEPVVEGVQASAVSCMVVPEVPTRSVTVMAPLW